MHQLQYLIRKFRFPISHRDIDLPRSTVCLTAEYIDARKSILMVCQGVVRRKHPYLEEPGFAPIHDVGATPRHSSFTCRRTKSGGGGIRTPVPRCFETSIYIHSRFIIFSPCLGQTTGLWFGYFGIVVAEAARKVRFSQPAVLRPCQPRGQDLAGRAA